MTKTNSTKTTRATHIEQLGNPLLTQFHFALSNSPKLPLEQLKEASELRGFSSLPISDIRLVTEMMGGMNLVSARRKGKPSRIQCLNYIMAEFQDKLTPAREEYDFKPSKDERHDEVSYPSSGDEETD